MTSGLSDAERAAGARLMARLDAFAAFTDEPGRLTRLFLSDAHRRAAAAFIGWCAETGIAARIDAAGNVVARYEGRAAGAPALMLGSHIDTVRDAGRYDGNYGALAALAVVEELAAARRTARPRGRDRRLRRRGGRALPHHADRIAGARGRLSGGRARPEGLGRRHDARRARGVRRRRRDRRCSLRAENVAAFVELHIEQGPVLEAEGLPIGVVTAINGATRLEVGVDGMAGHAGATPMALRRDAFAAAAEMALMIERRARAEPDLVATIGRMEVWPGAANVIPGHAQFSIDLRAPLDARREAALPRHPGRHRGRSLRERRVTATVAITHEAPAFTCDPRIVAGLTKAVESLGVPVRLLPSGAGHDTMAIGRLCPAGMLFVRCKGGVSHNPLESITAEDCALGLAALTRFVRGFEGG